MRRRGRWLCPTELDRARVVDANERVRTLRFVSLAALGVALFAGAPWEGWLYPALLVPVGLTFLGVDLMIKRVARPERVSAAAIVITLGVLSLGVALNGGSKSAALPWLILPVLTAAARFRPQVVIAAMMLTVCRDPRLHVGPDPSRRGERRGTR